MLLLVCEIRATLQKHRRSYFAYGLRVACDIRMREFSLSRRNGCYQNRLNGELFRVPRPCELPNTIILVSPTPGRIFRSLNKNVKYLPRARRLSSASSEGKSELIMPAYFLPRFIQISLRDRNVRARAAQRRNICNDDPHHRDVPFVYNVRVIDNVTRLRASRILARGKA